MQIFASSPGAWKPPVVDPMRVADFRQARSEYGISPLFIHAIYLINLGSADSELVERSIQSLIATLQAGSQLGAQAVITHLGSHAGRGFEAMAQAIAEALVTVVDAAPPDIDLALENSAGAGNIVGSTIEELGMLLRYSGRHPRLKIALDTAHLCGAGWDFHDPSNVCRLVESVQQHVGLERLVLLHANDSRAPCGSRKDRHACIGEGHIGVEGFRSLLAEPTLLQVPWILETPDLSEGDMSKRIQSLKTLTSLAETVQAERMLNGT